MGPLGLWHWVEPVSLNLGSSVWIALMTLQVFGVRSTAEVLSKGRS